MEVSVVDLRSEGYPMGMKDVESQPDLFVLGAFAEPQVWPLSGREDALDMGLTSPRAWAQRWRLRVGPPSVV